MKMEEEQFESKKKEEEEEEPKSVKFCFNSPWNNVDVSFLSALLLESLSQDQQKRTLFNHASHEMDWCLTRLEPFIRTHFIPECKTIYWDLPHEQQWQPSPEELKTVQQLSQGYLWLCGMLCSGTLLNTNHVEILMIMIHPSVKCDGPYQSLKPRWEGKELGLSESFQNLLNSCDSAAQLKTQLCIQFNFSYNSQVARLLEASDERRNALIAYIKSYRAEAKELKRIAQTRMFALSVLKRYFSIAVWIRGISTLIPQMDKIEMRPTAEVPKVLTVVDAHVLKKFPIFVHNGLKFWDLRSADPTYFDAAFQHAYNIVLDF